MTGLQDYYQPPGSDDILIGTLLFRILMISTLTGTVISHDETEAYCNRAFQTFNWKGMMRSVESSDEFSQTTMEDKNIVRDHGVALLEQTYRVCPESQRFQLIWMLADKFSPTASGLTRYSSPGVTMVETSNPSLPSIGHSEPGRSSFSGNPAHLLRKTGSVPAVGICRCCLSKIYHQRADLPASSHLAPRPTI